MTQLSTPALFTQYLDVVNRALGSHRDETPYKQMIEAAESLLGDKRIGVAIFTDDPTQPHDFFTIEVRDGGTLRILEHGKESPTVTWRVSQSHLEKVVESPQEFVDNPYQLELDWLRERARALLPA